MIAHIIFPSACASCGRESGANLLCEICEISLYPNPDPCLRCALPGHRGSYCPHPLETIGQVRAPYLYGGELAVAIRACKYGRRSDLARRLGRFVAIDLRHFTLDLGADVVVPIPNHWRSRLRTGMDHARELAIASRPPAPVRPALRKQRLTPRQATLKRSQRQASVQGAFAVRRRWRRRIRGRRVVLFDDVVTTGATLSAAALAVSSAGGIVVGAFALARAED